MNKLNTLANWKSAELYTDQSWIYTLNQQDLDELDTALNYLKHHENFDPYVPSSLFPLSALRHKLAQISDYIENNRGVFLLRGLPVNNYSETDMRLIFAGMGSYLGTCVRQSIAGDYIYEVMDKGISLKNGARGTATNDSLPFHTDRSDVVALLCLRKSKSGGQSRVVSAVAIHNEMLRRDPELLQLLYEPFYHSRTQWETGHAKSFYALPIFTQYAGHFAARYLRHFINEAQNIPGVPEMTPKQIAALDLLEEIATDPDVCADMEFLPGDVQLLNNFVTLHSRAGYEDHVEMNDKRKLLRLWLSVPNSRPLSPAFQPLYHATGAGQLRGGVLELKAA